MVLTTIARGQCHRALQQNCGTRWLTGDEADARFCRIGAPRGDAAPVRCGYLETDPASPSYGRILASGAGRRGSAAQGVAASDREGVIEEWQ
jgi:hypothetical protein